MYHPCLSASICGKKFYPRKPLELTNIMSEYQYVAFRAVDRPLTDEQLEFMHTQSTRAEISRWSFANEYHFGDFRGNVDKILQSGYDVHLHYANYGTRRVALRLAQGLPFADEVWLDYCDGEDGFEWKEDKTGPGGILDWSPFHDGDSIDQLWAPHEYLEDCVALRDRLIQGDLRALYLIWLCTASGDYSNWEATEPPVPFGLAEFADLCGGLLGFFGVDPLMLVAAAQVTPAFDGKSFADPDDTADKWIAKMTLADARKLLTRFLTEDPLGVKAEALALIRGAQPIAVWPTVLGSRSLVQLHEITEELRDQEITQAKSKADAKAKRDAKKAEQERQKRMKQMKANPDSWLDEASKLAAARGRDNYLAAAQILADLRDAIGGAAGQKLSRAHAAHLCKKHPTLTQLKGSLRKKTLVD